MDWCTASREIAEKEGIMIVLLTGNEPYKYKMELDQIKKKYGDLGVSEYDSLSDEVFEDCRMKNLFSREKAVVVYCSGLPESEGFLKYVKDPSKTTDLYLIDEQLDRRSAVFKTCMKGKYSTTMKVLNKVSKENFLLMCAGMVQRRGCKVRETTLQKLFEYTGYSENENCNLFDISFAIKQMCYQVGPGEEVTPALVEAFATPWQEAVIWQLSDVLFSGSKKELLSLAEHLLVSGENPIGMLSTLLRQFRLAYKAKIIGGSEKALSSELGVQVYRLRNVCACSEKTISEVLGLLQRYVNEIKNGAEATAVFRMALCKTWLAIQGQRAS